MRYGWIIGVLLIAGCSSPTAPTSTNPPVVPVVTTPAVMPNALLSDPRFDVNFYRMLALGSHDLKGKTTTLRRHVRPPMLYIMTVDNTGAPIAPATLDATAAALINTTPLFSGGMGVEGLEYGTAVPQSPFVTIPGRINVMWDGATTNSGLCARSDVGGSLMTVFLRTPGCTPCLGLQVAPAVIKHELGHILGFWHTDSQDDLMGLSGTATCDRNPSPREQFHARVAYGQANGSRDPM